MKGCDHCSRSGIYIGYVGYRNNVHTGSQMGDINYNQLPCKYCDGKGYIDEDEMMTVPRKYVKDEYFDK